ncbi:hypothetical protein [Streptomyces xanthophaeus]|uniref:hypothetical protein n=1 Tax=Streptomyces xanthophaeus TaxID=67385 RepID=UPI002647D0C1|nr:hypothetical protein [Streptomyces xanthophaeus]WKD31147.1 hypothetical protein KO717_03645 [Streptomyces xanthophaeus]
MSPHLPQSASATASSADTAEMAEMAEMAKMPRGETVTDGMGGECPAMAMDCPLASAHVQGAVVLASPPASPLPPAPTDQVPASWASAVGCARPRAPDPVSLLCISRT